MGKYFSNANTLEQLRKQYKELLKKHHPDNGGNFMLPYLMGHGTILMNRFYMGSYGLRLPHFGVTQLCNPDNLHMRRIGLLCRSLWLFRFSGRIHKLKSAPWYHPPPIQLYLRFGKGWSLLGLCALALSYGLIILSKPCIVYWQNAQIYTAKNVYFVHCKPCISWYNRFVYFYLNLGREVFIIWQVL